MMYRPRHMDGTEQSTQTGMLVACRPMHRLLTIKLAHPINMYMQAGLASLAINVILYLTRHISEKRAALLGMRLSQQGSR